MSKRRSEISKATPVISVPNTGNTEFVYYIANFTNNTDNEVLATFYDSRSEPIIDRPSSYKLAVVKFNVRVEEIPMFNIAQTNFVFYFWYQPDNIVITQPLLLTSGLVYNQVAFTEMPGGLNDSLAAGFSALKSSYNLIHGPGSWEADASKPQFPPAFQFSTSSHLFSLYFDKRWQSLSLFLYFSIEFYKLISGIAVDQLAPTPPPSIPSSSGGPIALYTTFTSDNIVSISGVDYLFMTQIYDTTSTWYTISRLVITSNTLGIRPTYISTLGGETNNIQLHILVDHYFDTDNSPDKNPSVTYGSNVSAPLQWIDIFADSPLTKIDLQVWYLTENNTLTPLNVLPGDSFSITLLFAKVVL